MALVATNAPAALGLFMLIVCTPLASVLMVRFQVAKTKLTFSLERSCTVGDAQALIITLARPALLRSRVELVFELENLLIGTRYELPIVLSPTSTNTEHYELALRTDSPGTVRVKLVSARVHDVLGFCEPHVASASFDQTYTVYPMLAELELRMRLAGSRSDSGSNYDLNRPGKDRNEVFEIRSFEQGDSYKDVHWKLSARTRDLVVRVPSRPADHDVALLLGAHPIDTKQPGDLRVLSAELSLLASASLALLRAGVAHLVLHPTPQGLKALPVESSTAYYAMVEELLCSPLMEVIVDNPDAFAACLIENNISKTIVITDLVNNEMFSKLGNPAQMSVIHVNDKHRTGADDEAPFTLMHVAASDVPHVVKVLEL